MDRSIADRGRLPAWVSDWDRPEAIEARRAGHRAAGKAQTGGQGGGDARITEDRIRGKTAGG